jgi:streptomycin 6-kinase
MSGPDYFGFVPIEELPGGHCSRVWTDGPRVLKVPFQGEEMTTGRLAAERMSGWPGVRVLASDVATGALLMDRLGDPLSATWSAEDDDKALDIFLNLALAMRKISPEGMMDLSAFFPTDDPLASYMLKTTSSKVFLHGDLHHENILRDPNEDRWLAIDPKGLVGDPAHEAAAYVRNPVGHLAEVGNMDQLLRNRIERLAEGLNVPAQRIWGWSLLEVRSESNEPGSDWDLVQKALEAMTDYHPY